MPRRRLGHIHPTAKAKTLPAAKQRTDVPREDEGRGVIPALSLLRLIWARRLRYFRAREGQFGYRPWNLRGKRTLS